LKYSISSSGSSLQFRPHPCRGPRPAPWGPSATARAGPGRYRPDRALPTSGSSAPSKWWANDLVEEVEVAFAFDQDRSRGGVEIVQGMDQTGPRALCRVRNDVGLTGIPCVFEFVEKVDEHDCRPEGGSAGAATGGRALGKILAFFEEHAQKGDVVPGASFLGLKSGSP
jgi:hypothetical protein